MSRLKEVMQQYQAEIMMKRKRLRMMSGIRLRRKMRAQQMAIQKRI